MSKMIVKFYECDQIADEYLKFAVIAAKHDGKWIFCRHRERVTYEIPGGHREDGENIDDTAKRELVEETGAVRFSALPICAYSVTDNMQTTYGKLYFAEIFELGSLSFASEMAEIYHFSTLPDTLTYPAIQPVLYEKVQAYIASGKHKQSDVAANIDNIMKSEYEKARDNVQGR